MIIKNYDDNDSIVMRCPCENDRCHGELSVDPDFANGEELFMFTVMNNKGTSDALVWLNMDQVKMLITELQMLVDEHEQE